MSTPEARKRARNKYQSEHKADYTFIHMRLNKKNDADIIEHLKKEKNIQGYIKELIRMDMAKYNH